MERIKEALEKAREQRGAHGGHQPPADKTGGRNFENISEIDIRYSSTQVVSIDQERLLERKVVLGEATSEAATAYKMLRTQVLQRMVAKGWNALAITSPALGDGKSLTAVNLAISLARELHHTVLLADLDLRNPSIHRYFGLQPKYGIEDYLLGQVELGEVLINPGLERLVLLPAVTPMQNSSEVLASPAMGRLVQDLKTRYPSRFVLFDLPPVLAADDALSFVPYADAFLLVLRESKTTRQELEQAVEMLKSVPIVGTVLNDSSEKISTYY